MKKSGLPVWFPYLSSWLSAFTLSVLLIGFIVIIRSNNGLLLYLTRLSEKPELLTILLILLIVSPIPAIALVYHFFLSRFISTIPGEKNKKPEGLIPGLISWWESIYGWLVLVLSTLIATVFCTPLLPLFKLNYKTIIYTYNQPHKNIEAIFAIVWLLSAAIFYQIEYLVKLRLVFGDSVNSNPESTDNETSVDIISNNKQDDIGSTQIQIDIKPATKKPTIFDWLSKQENLPKKIFAIIFIPLVALWLYQFAKLPEVRQTISTNLPLEQPSSVTLESAVTKSKSPNLPQKSDIATQSKSSDLLRKNVIATQSESPDLQPKNDTFEQAVKKGKRAAKLKKKAQTRDEWKIVENKWKEAIELLETVPTSSPNYALAQQKIIQYQAHLDFARQNAVGGELGR